MNIIEYKQLYEHLTQVENLKPWEAIHNIAKIRKLSPEILEAMRGWLMYHVIPETLNIHGVTFAELTEIEDLKPIQAFLMLDWLKRDPVAAMRFMEVERFKSPIKPLSEEENRTVKEAIRRLREMEVKAKEEKVAESLDDLTLEEKADIEVPTKVETASEEKDQQDINQQDIEHE